MITHTELSSQEKYFIQHLLSRDLSDPHSERGPADIQNICYKKGYLYVDAVRDCYRNSFKGNTSQWYNGYRKHFTENTLQWFEILEFFSSI